MLRRLKGFVAIILVVVFIIPATGLSISKHLCLDCHDSKLSLIYHHGDHHNVSCSHEQSENNWHFHFFEKHHEHKMKCKYDVIKINTPYKESETLAKIIPLELFGFNIFEEKQLRMIEKISILLDSWKFNLYL